MSPSSAARKSRRAAFYAEVDKRFYAQVAANNGGKLPNDLLGPDGKPRRLTQGPKDRAYRQLWRQIAAQTKKSKAVPTTVGASTPCVSPSPMAEYNREMQDKAANSAKFFSGAQSNKDTCALMTTDSILWEKTGSPDPPKPSFGVLSWLETLWADMNMDPATPQNEKEMIGVGNASGGYQWCTGTTDPAAVMTAAGLPATDKLSPSLEDIAGAVEAGKGVLVGYDTRPVWGGRWLKNPKPAGHAVRVTGIQRDDSGNITGFYVNDSGNGKAPEFIDTATFKQGLDGMGYPGFVSVMSETDEPAFTPISNPMGGAD